MKIKRTARVLAWMACAAMLSPTAAFGGQPPYSPAGHIHDVALESGGVFHGQVVDIQGQPISCVPVVIVGQAAAGTHLTTDAAGNFATKLSGGIFQIQTADTVTTCRAWAAQTAPPIAADRLLVVADSEVVRGQYNCPPGTPMGGPMPGGYVGGPPCGPGPAPGGSCCGPSGAGHCSGGFLGLISNPWFVGAVVAAAIAIPLALDSSDDDSAS